MFIVATDVVSEVMNRWPATMNLFIARKMLCVGCYIGPFHTVAEACDEHGVELGPFLDELNRIARPDAPRSAPAGEGPEP